MTYEEYINNPLQARFVANAREYYRAAYTSRLDAILVRVNNKIDFNMYKNDKDGSYYLYIKVPSEVVKDFTYDVVIHFVRPGHDVDFDKDLKSYEVEFFSNDPVFVYDLAYTFKSHNMFVNDLAPKAVKESLTRKPVVTNPNNTIFYCKSLYFAYLIAKEKGLFAKAKYTEKYDRKRMLDMVEDSRTKVEQRQELGAKADKEERKIRKEKQVKEAIQSSKAGKKINFEVSQPKFSMKALPTTPVAKSNKINFNKNKKV